MGSVARYSCDECGMEFDSITQLDDHIRISHSNKLNQ
jgi:predicted nucleic acid-binding Zn ribbon protein